MGSKPQVCRFEEGKGSEGNHSISHSHSHSHEHNHSHHHNDRVKGRHQPKPFNAIEHGHDHAQLDHPGRYEDRDMPIFKGRDWSERSYTVGIGGPVGSGKTALMLALCQRLRTTYKLCCVTNDIFTKEDTDFLIRNEALEPERIKAIETGGCPHAAIREDISANLNALEELQVQFNPQLLLVESGGDNLAANYSRELADYIIYVIDVAGGDKIPRKGGPGITQSDLLVINKTDLAPAVGADLEVMRRDSNKMRQTGPTVFAQVKHGEGMQQIIDLIIEAWKDSGAYEYYEASNITSK